MTVHRMLGRSKWLRRLNTHQKCVVFGPVGLLMNAFSCEINPAAGFAAMLRCSGFIWGC